MCGIQITDYFFIRRRSVKLSDLYSPSHSGIYYFWNGINPRAFIAWVFGWAPQLPGFIANVNPDVVVPAACMKMFYLAFPLGLVISATVYYSLCRLAPPQGIGEVDDVDYYGTFNAEESAKLGISSLSQMDGVEKDSNVNVIEGVEKGF